jgi:hypothetical protein
MEYLMTYGWAILVIAVVLSALFALGLFSSNNLSGNSCIASPGYLCSGAIYSHSDANIIVGVGQSTGADWVTANFVFVPQGTPDANGVPAISFSSSPANTLLATSGMASGTIETLYLPANSIVPPVNVGSSIVGTIWAQYTYTVTSGGITTVVGPSYVQIASLNLKAS